MHRRSGQSKTARRDPLTVPKIDGFLVDAGRFRETKPVSDRCPKAVSIYSTLCVCVQAKRNEISMDVSAVS